MRNRRYQGRAQLVLELQPHGQRVLVTASTKGLVEALADLLLAALGMDVTTAAIEGGGDERQNHA